MTGFLLGGDMADVAVLNPGEDGERRLRVYAYAGEAWALSTDVSLRGSVSYADVVNMGGRDRLVTYGNGNLKWWDPHTETERSLATVASSFEPPRTSEIPHVDIGRDVNGDGRDDLVLPGVDGFLVFIQTDDGSFADPVEIGPPPALDRIYGADGYRYDPWSVSRVHEFDYDGDGRIDLVSWNEKHFEVHLQDEQGLFAAEPVTFQYNIMFDTDDLSYLAAGEMAGKVLHSFNDLNGDEVADMVVFSLEGDGISEKRSAYEVHFGARIARISSGRASDGQTTEGRTVDGRVIDGRVIDDRIPDVRTQFATELDLSIRSDGKIQLAMERSDFDGDGDSDLVVTTIDKKYLESSLFKRIKGFMGDDIWLNLEFYRVNEGRVPDHPTAIRRIQLDGAPSHREPGWVPLGVVLRGGKHVLRNAQGPYRRAFNKNFFIGDVTGDGRADLLIEWTHREMHVYAGIPGPDMFADEPQILSIESPNDEEYAWMTDLNRDGKQDIVMHHPFSSRDAHGAPEFPLGDEPQRVTMLIAQ